MTGRSVVGLLVGRNLGRSVGRSGSGLVWYGSGLVAVGIWVGLFFRPWVECRYRGEVVIIIIDYIITLQYTMQPGLLGCLCGCPGFKPFNNYQLISCACLAVILSVLVCRHLSVVQWW